MRIITKWCEELEGNFKNVEEREEPYRMQDGNEYFLASKEAKILSAILKEEKKKINNFMKDLMKNNFEHQASLSQEDHYEECDEFS